MTASEFTFLALGLVLGVVSGAALIEVLRARPPAPREVRVTVSTDAIPRRRSATLSEDAFTTTPPQPARGGPADRRGLAADRRLLDFPMTTSEIDRRTAVRSGVTTLDLPRDATAAGSFTGRLLESAMRREPGGSAPRLTLPDDVTAIGRGSGPVLEGGHDPILSALRIGRITSDLRRPEPLATARLDASPGAVAVLERPTLEDLTILAVADPAGAAPDAGAGGGANPGAAEDATDRCASERRIAAERCSLAVRARAGATETADAVRLAQRTYDEHVRRAEAATEAADPEAVRREKEAAQARFRHTYESSRTTEDAEAAAREWLVEINEINNMAKTAAALAKRERAAAATIAAGLERQMLGADAARIAAETAEAACLAARQALAECDERGSGAEVPPPAQPWRERPQPSDDGGDDEPLALALNAGGTPTIFRLVRGDHAALVAVVERLGGDDPAAKRRWQLALTGLVDAIVAVSIESGALVFPTEHPFWGMFTVAQDREISTALASLGHRFDGLGGFVDDRAPTQRDLSLAMGYAGLDPMRIRHWPTEAEMAALYHDVTVAADEHLAATAGDLSLSELVALLGRRADGLAGIWNEWGRVRPLLLEGA